MLLVCLLLVAQWTGFSMVLCVSSAGHVELERFNAGCCAPHRGHGASLYGAVDCTSCTDIDTGSAFTAAGHDGGYALPLERVAFRSVAVQAPARRVELPPVSRVLAAASPLRC